MSWESTYQFESKFSAASSADGLFNHDNSAFCANGLYAVVKRVFQCVFKIAPDSGLFEAYVSYFAWQGEFSAKSWLLEEYAAMYKKESTLPYPGTTNTSRHQLSCLAKLVLSVVANSAGAERLFNRMGHIHSKRRNRMHHDKVHDLATLVMDLDAQHRAAGLEQAGHTDVAEPNDHPDSASKASDDEDEGEMDDEAAVDLKVLAARVAEAVDEDNDPEESECDEDLPAAADLVG
ncbi:hypothetical protein FRC06_008583 [Ceratobasidium sp. 370]|nr:hypothetical protein FRC06_008583 [Ceratobasidium sp. 370]